MYASNLLELSEQIFGNENKWKWTVNSEHEGSCRENSCQNRIAEGQEYWADFLEGFVSSFYELSWINGKQEGKMHNNVYKTVC